MYLSQELSTIERFFSSLFSCDLDSFPMELKTHEFLPFSGSGWTDYIRCVNTTLGKDPGKHRVTCAGQIAHYCARSVPMNLKLACNKLMKLASLPYKIPTDWLLDIGGQEIPELIMDQPRNFALRFFEGYAKCMNEPRTASVINKCYQSVIRNCQSAKVVATKTLRLYVKDLEPMLRRHATWRLVHLVRDPRAVVLSQRAQFSFLRNVSIHGLARQICTKMFSDMVSTTVSLRETWSIIHVVSEARTCQHSVSLRETCMVGLCL